MGITSSLDLFLIFAACLLICASSFAGPVDRVGEMESSRSFEFFQLAGVSQWPWRRLSEFFFLLQSVGGELRGRSVDSW